MNKYVNFGVLVCFVSCQGMYNPLDTMRIVNVSDQAFEARRNGHVFLSRNFEREELAARPSYEQNIFYGYVAQRSYKDVLSVLIRSADLQEENSLVNRCDLARDLLTVYTGGADGFSFNPAQYPVSTLAITHNALWLANKSGNFAFLKRYKQDVNPDYVIESPRRTFSSSSSEYSSSRSDD